MYLACQVAPLKIWKDRSVEVFPVSPWMKTEQFQAKSVMKRCSISGEPDAR